MELFVGTSSLGDIDISYDLAHVYLALKQTRSNVTVDRAALLRRPTAVLHTVRVFGRLRR